MATLGFSRSGGQLALLGYAAGIAHALAMAVWLGGLILLARVVLAGPGEEDLVHAVRGFARISTPALAVTILTGFIQMYRLDWGEIFTSSHGRVLFLKSIAVGAMVFLGVAARQFIKERVARVDAMTGQLAIRLRRAVGIEAICGVVVLALTAWMMSLSPPKVAATTTTPTGLAASLHITDDTADVTVGFSAVVGPNAVRVEVDKPETGVAGLAIDFSPPAGAVGPRRHPQRAADRGRCRRPADRTGHPDRVAGRLDRHGSLRCDADRLQDGVLITDGSTAARSARRRRHDCADSSRPRRRLATQLATAGRPRRRTCHGLATSSWS